MVFDGKKGNYSEGDSPNPKSLYGWQKLKAEEIILEKNPNAAIVRTAIISGNSPSCTRSIHERLFQEWANGRIPVLFTDEFRQPVSSENLSQVLLRLAMNNSSGIFHWAGRDVLSRYEMGLGILDRFKIPGAFIKAVSIKSDSNNKDRPSDLTMDISKLKNELGILPESFSDQLLNMKIPAKFAEWYSKNSSLVVI